MKISEPIISEVTLICRTKVKASERAQKKCSRDTFDLFMITWNFNSVEHVEELT